MNESVATDNPATKDQVLAYYNAEYFSRDSIIQKCRNHLDRYEPVLSLYGYIFYTSIINALEVPSVEILKESIEEITERLKTKSFIAEQGENSHLAVDLDDVTKVLMAVLEEKQDKESNIELEISNHQLLDSILPKGSHVSTDKHGCIHIKGIKSEWLRDYTRMEDVKERLNGEIDESKEANDEIEY